MTTTTDRVRIFAIGDLHLPGGSEKPMDIFGAHWEGHFVKISRDWMSRVQPHDIILIPGDISWAMQMEAAKGDLYAIASLPGRKILIRGNHDYWWSSISKLRGLLPEGMFALQNDAVLLDGYVFCGSRGWTIPEDENDLENQRLYQRELMRVELSLQRGKALAKSGEPMIAMIHYPPVEVSGQNSPMSELFDAYGVRHVVYGHLHGAANANAFKGMVGQVQYYPVSCDGLGFRLFELPCDGTNVGQGG